MATEIMESILVRLDRNQISKSQYSESLQSNLTYIKLIFLPKCTISRLYSLQLPELLDSSNVGTISNFQMKKDEGKKVSHVIQEVDILWVTYWLKSVWKNISAETIKYSF